MIHTTEADDAPGTGLRAATAEFPESAPALAAGPAVYSGAPVRQAVRTHAIALAALLALVFGCRWCPARDLALLDRSIERGLGAGKCPRDILYFERRVAIDRVQ
jgi:hypothetical protein